MGNLFSRISCPEQWLQVCDSNDHQHCARLALYTLVSAVLSEIIYRCDQSDGSVPLSRAEFAHKLVDAQRQYSWFRPSRFSMSVSETPDEAVYALVDFGKFDVLVVRGSVTNHDWECNYATSPCSWKGLEGYHLGFCKRAQSVPADFITHLDSSKPTIFCGHSMGGAVATMCALPLIQQKRNVYAISFGAPSIIQVNPIATEPELKKRFLRFALSQDAVPMICQAKRFTVFERLVVINSSGESMDIDFDQNELTGSTSIIGSLSSYLLNRAEVSRQHSVTEYKTCALQLCGFSATALNSTNVMNFEALENGIYVPVMCINNQSIHMVCNKAEHEVFMDIMGQGAYAGVVAAATYGIDAGGSVIRKSRNVATFVSYDCDERLIPTLNDVDEEEVECSFCVKFQVTHTTSEGRSVLNDSDDILLCLSNGFESVKTKCRFYFENNVARFLCIL